MAYNFLRGDRDQPFLLPPDLRDWLPEGHLAWCILDVVGRWPHRHRQPSDQVASSTAASGESCSW
jgi:hypothetical protein